MGLVEFIKNIFFKIRFLVEYKWGIIFLGSQDIK